MPQAEFIFKNYFTLLLQTYSQQIANTLQRLLLDGHSRVSAAVWHRSQGLPSHGNHIVFEKRHQGLQRNSTGCVSPQRATGHIEQQNCRDLIMTFFSTCSADFLTFVFESSTRWSRRARFPFAVFKICNNKNLHQTVSKRQQGWSVSDCDLLGSAVLLYHQSQRYPCCWAPPSWRAESGTSSESAGNWKFLKNVPLWSNHFCYTSCYVFWFWWFLSQQL